jgi:hypothetical protein
VAPYSRRPEQVSLVRVCLNDVDAYVKFELRDLEPGGEHRLLGQVRLILAIWFSAGGTVEPEVLPARQAETTVRQLLQFTKSAGGAVTFSLVPSSTKELAKPVAATSMSRTGKPKYRGPVVTLGVALHQSGDGAKVDDGGDDRVLPSTADDSISRQQSSDGGPRRRRRKGQRRSAAKGGKTAIYSEDATFLAELLADSNIFETDLKDIVGDGISFIQQRQEEGRKSAARENAERANSIHDRHNEQAGLGYQLEAPAGVTGLPHLSTRVKGRRRKKSMGAGDDSFGCDGSPEPVNRSESLPLIGERSDLMKPAVAMRSQMRSKSGAGAETRRRTKKGGGATNPDQLPKLNVTHRMELLTMPDQKNMDPHHLGLKKPKSRRTVPETADELQRRRLGEGALGAISVAVMSTPTARELKHQHKRAARAR